MTAFRVLVGDDEPLALSMLADLVRQDGDVRDVIACDAGARVREAIARHAPHIVFLDIEMPDENGLRIAEGLPADGPVVVFVTAFSKYATQAFDVRAVDYVMKPFSDRRFKEALERAKQRVRERRLAEAAGRRTAPEPQAGPAEGMPDPAASYLERVSIKEGGRSVVLAASAILWIEAQDYYACVHSTRGRHLVRETLASLEARLDPRSFVRVHRAAIVNLGAVQDVQGRSAMRLTLTDGARVTVSRARRRRVEAAIDRLRERWTRGGHG